MGFNTTVIVMNDALHNIKNDPNFGKKLCYAIMANCATGEKQDVSAGGDGNSIFANAATVIESHHASFEVAFIVGENTARALDVSDPVVISARELAQLKRERDKALEKAKDIPKLRGRIQKLEDSLADWQRPRATCCSEWRSQVRNLKEILKQTEDDLIKILKKTRLNPDEWEPIVIANECAIKNRKDGQMPKLKLTREQAVIQCLMQYLIDKDIDDSEPKRPDKCRMCEREWWFGEKEQHKTWCVAVEAYEILYGKLPDNVEIV